MSEAYNDLLTAQLQAKVDTLKGLSTEIRIELRRQNTELEETLAETDRVQSLLQKTVKWLKRIFG